LKSGGGPKSVPQKEETKEEPKKVDFRAGLKTAPKTTAAPKKEETAQEGPVDPNACPKCKNAVRVGAKFCTKCGFRLTK